MTLGRDPKDENRKQWCGIQKQVERDGAHLQAQLLAQKAEESPLSLHSRPA